MKTSVDIIARCPGVENWAIGVYTVDWEPGRKYYGGHLVNGKPDPTGPGKWFTSKAKAWAHADQVRREMHDE
jgi:hypothetical protein